MKKITAAIAATTLALGGVALAALPASATVDAYSITTSHAAVCGSVSITLDNNSPWIYPVSYSTDGTIPTANGPEYGPVVDNRGEARDVQSGTKTLTFAEDANGGVVTVKYVVAAGTESDLYRDLPVGSVTTVDVDTDCQPPVVVEPIVKTVVTWTTALQPGVTTPTGAADVTWPQQILVGPQLCGVWYQVDSYIGTQAQIDAVIGDGVLTNIGSPEDSAILDYSVTPVPWRFDFAPCPPVPEKPKPVKQVVVTLGEYDCEDTTLTETTTTTDVGHALVDNVWVLNPQPSDRAKVATREVPLTAEQVAALDCPGVEPPVVEPPVTPSTLAHTGGSGADGIGVAAAGLLALGGALLFLRRKLASV